MTALLRQARTLVAVFYAEEVEYRVELFLWVLSNLLPFILMGVWWKAGLSGRFGISQVDLARYFFATFLVQNFTLVWVVWEFEQDVVLGRLSPYLLQPMDPGWRHVAAHLAEKGARLPFVIGLAAIFFAIYPEAMWRPGLREMCVGVFAILMTFALRYCAQYAFAMLAFWTERAHSVEQLWFLPYMFLSGRVAPLEVYPDWLREVLPYTPFPYLIWFPSQALLGADVDLAGGLAVTAVWTAAFFLLHRILWRAGLKKYSAMGA